MFPHVIGHIDLVEIQTHLALEAKVGQTMIPIAMDHADQIEVPIITIAADHMGQIGTPMILIDMDHADQIRILMTPIAMDHAGLIRIPMIPIAVDLTGQIGTLMTPIAMGRVEQTVTQIRLMGDLTGRMEIRIIPNLLMETSSLKIVTTIRNLLYQKSIPSTER